MNPQSRLVPTSTTRKLQVLVALCSLLFAVGSALHTFAIVDTDLMETIMRLAGGADPAADAPGFTTGFRIVGCVYIVGNALGALALWSRSGLLWWWVLAVNVTQGLGFVLIPGDLLIPDEMWTAVADRYGAIGMLPSVVTDGGAVILSLLLIAAMVRFRSPWAQRRVLRQGSPDPRS